MKEHRVKVEARADRLSMPPVELRRFEPRRVSGNRRSRKKREAWVVGVFLAASMIFAGAYFAATFRWIHQAQMVMWIATPVAKSMPFQPTGGNFRGLLVRQEDTDNEIHLKSFDYVWEKINESYWEEDFGGVDWEQAREDLRPRVAEAENIEEVRKIMNELISRLGKSHFAIIPASVYEATEVQRKGKAESGMEFRLADGKVLVTSVRLDSDAHRQGVRPGWEVLVAAGQSASEFVSQALKHQGVVRPDTLIALRFPNLLTGESDATVDCRFRLPDGQERELKLGLVDPPGQVVRFGNLPEMRIDMESKLLDSNVGYFRFNGFFDPVRLMPEFRKAVQRFQSAEGLIVDIRGNGGGMIGMTMGMASPLAEEPAPLGVMKMKDAELKLALFKNPNPYRKKIAILVDEASASASEIYSGGLQDLKIARIFGRRTAGLSLPSNVEKLPNGDGFQYAFANYTSAAGRVLEGEGVVPDEVIGLTVENLTEQHDPTLKAAIEWIRADAE